MATRRLPTMEDAAIEELDALAESYVKYRDKRMALLEKEVELKASLLETMKKHKKTTYKYDGHEIWIEEGEETVRVKAIKADPEKE